MQRNAWRKALAVIAVATLTTWSAAEKISGKYTLHAVFEVVANGNLALTLDPKTPLLDVKAVLNTKKRVLRGKLSGEVVNDSNRKARFEDNPIVDEQCDVSSEDEFGFEFETARTTLKVSAKGGAKGKFTASTPL